MKRPFIPPPALLALVRAAALGGVFSLFTSATASASPTYPAVVQKHFDLAAPPPCLLCHDEPEGGYGTINRQVGDYLDIKANIDGKLSEAELVKVLDKWEDDQDSDEDDAPDLDELQAGSDPNDPDETPDNVGRGGGDGPAEQRLTSVGCSYAVTPPGAGGLALVAMGGLALGARARRRPKRR